MISLRAWKFSKDRPEKSMTYKSYYKRHSMCAISRKRKSYTRRQSLSKNMKGREADDIF